jgi:hypothetical protein
VAFFRYSPVDILSVNLPPSVLCFNCHSPQDWTKTVAVEVYDFQKSMIHIHFFHRTCLLICCVLKNKYYVHVLLFVDIWPNEILTLGDI